MQAIKFLHFSNKLGRRLLIQSLAIALGLTILLTALQVWLNYQGLLATIQNTENQIEQVTVGGISTALWNFSNPEVIAQTQGLVHYPFITYAEVRDNNSLVTSAGKPKLTHVLQKTYPLVHLVNGQISNIGTLLIQVDTDQVTGAIISQVGQILLFQALNVTLVVLLLLLLINWQITRHLTTAANYMDTLDLAKLEVPLILDKRNAQDEIDILADNFNRMRVNLSGAYHDLTESERKYSTLVANLPGMAYRAKNDRARSMLLVSAGCTELTGCNAQDLLSDPKFSYGNLIHPDDRDTVWNGIQNGLAENGSYELNYRLQPCSDQGPRWVLERGVGVYSENGQLQALEGFVIDITNQKKAENEVIQLNAELEGRVEERTAELSDLYNNAPCGYHSLDGDGLYLLINDTELRWLGYQQAEIVGRMNFTDLLTPASRAQHRTIYTEFKERGFVNEVEYELVRKDGSVLPVLLTSTALNDAQGNFVMSRTTIIDNTERKRADEARRLAQARLETANVELEYANKELEAFSYSVSHDLRSPLRAIDGFSRIIENEYGKNLDGESLRLFSIIHQNILKMDHLITDLLALSRVSRIELAISPVDMAELAGSIFTELTLGDNHAPVLELRPLPTARADPGLIRQVWSNLIGNAIKYSVPRAERCIEIGGYPENGTVVYYVRDNGVGFDPAYSDKLFGTFQRLHKDSEFEGNGVGLAIVKRVITRLGGRVWAESQLNQGATFYFSLPG